VLARAAGLIGVGTGLGLLGAIVLVRFISNLLFQTPPFDELTFAVASMLLAAVALLASYLPARRATRVDPMVTLRYE
jgi:putative ABC transport system permease protein